MQETRRACVSAAWPLSMWHISCHHLLLNAVLCRMTSLRRSNGGEPRPLRALDAQSISSRFQKDWGFGKGCGKRLRKTWKLGGRWGKKEERRELMSIYLCVLFFSQICPCVSLCVSLCISASYLSSYPPNLILSLISDSYAISPSGSIIRDSERKWLIYWGGITLYPHKYKCVSRM